MSAIIKEIYWQEYDTATQIRSVRADIICDALADLPSGGVMTDYKLDIGSRAKVIADGSDWEIQSSGSWVRQPSKLQLDLTGYSTEQYVDAGLAEKATVGSFDITLAGSPLVATEYNYSCIITGDIVTICVRIVLGDELVINTSRNLFKIPADYRPPVTCAGTGYANNKVRQYWVNTSGDIKIRIDEAIPAGSTINANFCYSYKSANWITSTP